MSNRFLSFFFFLCFITLFFSACQSKSIEMPEAEKTELDKFDELMEKARFDATSGSLTQAQIDELYVSLEQLEANQIRAIRLLEQQLPQAEPVKNPPADTQIDQMRQDRQNK